MSHYLRLLYSPIILRQEMGIENTFFFFKYTKFMCQQEFANTFHLKKKNIGGIWIKEWRLGEIQSPGGKDEHCK